MYFPVSNSNLSATHLGLFLQEKYGFSHWLTCTFIRAGINDTYLLTDGPRKNIFRVYSLNWRSETEIKEEIRLLNLLKEHEISVSYAIADQQERYIQTLPAPEGDRFGVLFSYAEGEKITQYSNETHFKVGELMARMHQITQSVKLDRVDYTAHTLLAKPFTYLEKFLPADAEEMAFMKSTQAYLLDAFAQFKTDELRTGGVHIDIWFDNINITKDNEITLFDFDFCGNGWLCIDMAYYILQIHSIEKDDVECTSKVASFLDGYASVSSISDEEKRIIPMLGVSMYFFYLGIQCERYENWSNSFLSENYLKRFINILVKKYFERSI